MSTRIVVHQAPGDEPGRGWDAYIEGHLDSFRVASFADLNETVSGLGIDDGDYYGDAVACEPPCGLAATGTVIWSGPDVCHVARQCDGDQAETIRIALQAGRPHAVVSGLPQVSRPYYSRLSYEDMADLTRTLVAYDIPPEVFIQPVCAQCGKRVCLSRDLSHDGVQWVDADGAWDCADGDAGHVATSLPPGRHEKTGAELTGEPVAASAE